MLLTLNKENEQYEPVLSWIEYLAFSKEKQDSVNVDVYMDILCKIIVNPSFLLAIEKVEISERGKEFGKFMIDTIRPYCDNDSFNYDDELVPIQNQNVINFFVDVINEIGDKYFNRLNALTGMFSIILSRNPIHNVCNTNNQITHILEIMLNYMMSNEFRKDIENEINKSQGKTTMDWYRKDFYNFINCSSDVLKECKDDKDCATARYFSMLKMMRAVVDSQLK